MQTLDVNLAPESCSYSLAVGAGGVERVGELVRAIAPDHKAMLIADAALASSYGHAAADSLRDAGYTLTTFELIAEESNKALTTVASMYEVMLAEGLERNSPVIAVGGGVVCDTAGYAAATYLRGVPLIHVPTTLLAMVDASIGGKTGVNVELPGGSIGKNLIGAFWQPRLIIADPQTLQSLSDRQLRCGLAECIKHGVIDDAGLLDLIETRIDAIMARDPETLTELVVRSASVKVKIVQQDAREKGIRAVLNLGHTFAHVVEPIKELNLHHGEAVAIGLLAALHCSVETNRVSSDIAGRIAELIERVGLPTTLPSPVDVDAAMRAMRYDKKVEDGRLRMILPTSRSSVEIVADVPDAVIRSAWRAVGAGAVRAQ